MKAKQRLIVGLLLSAMFGACLTALADEHWSFQPVRRVPPPAVADRSWGRNEIDRFIQARLEREGVVPSEEADRTTLLRRVMLDLIGLPPTIDEVDAFLADDHPDAYERVVDQLLASPKYGERWTRVWLDLCHYGDTDGHLTDQLRPVAWRYRDWVLAALNANLPFDEFTVLQLAGDLIPDATQEQILGTGFLRQTLSNREGGADLEEYRVEQVADRTRMIGAIWLGLTVGCARCHDHKYDPISQEDFFRLYACFDSTDEVNMDAPLPEEREAWRAAKPLYENKRQALLADKRAAIEELQMRWEEKLLHAVRHPGEDHIWDRQWELLGLIWGGGLGEGQLEGTEIVRLPWERRTSRQRDDLLDYFLIRGSIIDEAKFKELSLGELSEKLKSLRKEFPQPTRAPVMQAALNPRQTYVHEQGDFHGRGADVAPGTPESLPPSKMADNSPRLALARWLVSPENPLTPRVTVNRMWQEFFGSGLVSTSDDFGIRGEPPAHPELLDTLAADFIRSGWDVKRMHRRIVTSATYRQSSRPRPELSARDPQNTLLARQTSLRVPAETVRDAALMVSGLLSQKLGGPGVRPPQSDRVTMEAFGYNDWKVSPGEDRYRRGLYTFVLRTSPFAQGIIFDAPNPVDVCTRRDRSNTPLQALTLLNDPAFHEMASAMAERVMREGGECDACRLRYAVRLCLAREPTAEELRRLADYLAQQRAAAGDPDAWTNVCSVLLNLHEFITRD